MSTNVSWERIFVTGMRFARTMLVCMTALVWMDIPEMALTVEVTKILMTGNNLSVEMFVCLFVCWLACFFGFFFLLFGWLAVFFCMEGQSEITLWAVPDLYYYCLPHAPHPRPTSSNET